MVLVLLVTSTTQRLVAIGDSTPGQHATAKITFNASGTITEVNIMDGGSAYGVGNTMAVVGVATTTGYSQAVVQVSAIYDNVGDTIRVIGVKSESLQNYNDLYRITGVSIGAATTVTVAAAGVLLQVYPRQELVRPTPLEHTSI